MAPTCLSKATAEFLGTFVLMGAFTNVTINGSLLGALAVASSLMVAIYQLAKVSGAHFNPAVSVAVAVMNFLKWPGVDFGIADLAIYIAAQLSGASCGAFVNTQLWHKGGPVVSSTATDDSLVNATNATRRLEKDIADDNLWGTHLPWKNSVIQGALQDKGGLSVYGSETVYTFVLVFVILNVATCNDAGPKNNYFGLAIGFVIMAAAASVGGISFCCLNPAVSFGASLMNGIYSEVDDHFGAFGIYLAYSAFEILGALIACALFYVCRNHLKLWLGKKEPKGEAPEAGRVSKLLAEFLGTFVLCLTVQCVVNGNPGPLGPLGIASSLMVMIYALGAVSGANFNPAVSFGLFLNRSLGFVDFVLYVVVQLLAAVVAMLVAYLILGKLGFTLVVRDGTGDVAAAASGDWFAVLIAEMLFTGILVFTVLNVAVADGGNQYFGLAIGFVVVVGAASVGSVSGGCFNPAVAVSLDVASAFTGEWGEGSQYGWSWLYFVVELIAAAIAYGVFKIVRCDDQHEVESEEEEEGEEEDAEFQ